MNRPSRFPAHTQDTHQSSVVLPIDVISFSPIPATNRDAIAARRREARDDEAWGLNTRQKLYVLLMLVGLLVPNYLFMRTLLAADGTSLHTIGDAATLMFPTFMASAFVVDLLIATAIFFVWMVYEARSLGMRRVWLYILATLVGGLAFAMPLFLYCREDQLTSCE